MQIWYEITQNGGFMQELHQALKYLKTRNKWSNEECARNCKIAESTWKELISGRANNPRWDTIKALAEGFDVPTDYFNNVRCDKMLTLEEYDHMHMYRSLPVDVQNGIKAIVVERYLYWVEEYRKNDHYNVRLSFREECAKLPISIIRHLSNYIKSLPKDAYDYK